MFLTGGAGAGQRQFFYAQAEIQLGNLLGRRPWRQIPGRNFGKDRGKLLNAQAEISALFIKRGDHGFQLLYSLGNRLDTVVRHSSQCMAGRATADAINFYDART